MLVYIIYKYDNEGNIPEADKDVKPSGLNGVSLLFMI